MTVHFANAGTGKTLLLYDIAKEFISVNKKPLIIHCGKLNDGHCSLINNYRWNIRSIRSVSENSFDSLTDACDCIFVDESQRIRKGQLEVIIKSAIENNIPVIFSFDVKQYLRTGETCNIGDYLKENVNYVQLYIRNIFKQKSCRSFISDDSGKFKE